jgi:hypothetical protein
MDDRAFDADLAYALVSTEGEERRKHVFGP